MKKAAFLLLFAFVFCVPSADADEETRKAILGNDPVFDAKISRSPLNQFLKKVFRPEETIEERSAIEVPYEEAIPYGRYYPNEGRYYENPAFHELPQEEEKTYYESGGQYYLPPEGD